jgi:hypothetical protein
VGEGATLQSTSENISRRGRPAAAAREVFLWKRRQLRLNPSRKHFLTAQLFPSMITAADGCRFAILLPFYGNWGFISP